MQTTRGPHTTRFSTILSTNPKTWWHVQEYILPLIFKSLVTEMRPMNVRGAKK